MLYFLFYFLVYKHCFRSRLSSAASIKSLFHKNQSAFSFFPEGSTMSWVAGGCRERERLRVSGQHLVGIQVLRLFQTRQLFLLTRLLFLALEYWVGGGPVRLCGYFWTYCSWIYRSTTARAISLAKGAVLGLFLYICFVLLIMFMLTKYSCSQKYQAPVAFIVFSWFVTDLGVSVG